MALHVGDRVEWNWGNGTGEGEITERFESKVSRQIKVNTVTRDASQDDPAFIVQQDDGDRVLKSQSELKKV